MLNNQHMTCLKRYRELYPNEVTPLFVIDIHTRWDILELEKLFEWAKSVSPDHNLASFVFVFSESIYAYKPSIKFYNYRVAYADAKVPTDAEYLQENLKQLQYTENIEKISKLAHERGGNNFLL